MDGDNLSTAAARPRIATLSSRAVLLVVFVASWPGIALGAQELGPLAPDKRHPKAGQISLGGFGGSFLGASVGSSYSAGARAIYFITRLLGVGVTYTNSRLADGHDLGAVDSRAIHALNGQLELAVDSALRITGSTVLEVDLYGTFGGGAVQIADEWEGMGVIGGGVRAYTGLSWLIVRIDVTNFLHRVRREDGNRFESNVAFTLGVSVLLPPRQMPRRSFR